MSSSIIGFTNSYKRQSTRPSYEEIYNKDREYMKREFDKSINEVKVIVSKIPKDILDTIVWEIENFSKSILKSYTISVTQSASRSQWVNDRIKMFNSVTTNMKHLIRILDVEFLYGENIEKDTYSSLSSLIPSKFNTLRETIKKYVSASNQTIKKEVKNQSLKVIQEKKDIKDSERLKEEKKDSEKLKEEIKKLLSKIKAFDDNFEEEKYLYQIENADDYRLSLILEGLKVKYIKVREQSLFKEEVKELIKKLEEKNTEEAKRLIEKGQELLTKDTISKAEYNVFYEEVWRNLIKESEKEPVDAEQIISKLREMDYTIIDDEGLIKDVISKLREMGYSIIDDKDSIKDGEIVELKTPYGDDYILKVKIQNGNIATKFVRILEEERELPTYEKEKDIYSAKKWCQDFDKLREKLKEDGINLEIKARIEPEDIDYEIRKKDVRKGIKEERHGKPREDKRAF